jgi:hypothetical protein
MLMVVLGHRAREPHSIVVHTLVDSTQDVGVFASYGAYFRGSAFLCIFVLKFSFFGSNY